MINWVKYILYVKGDENTVLVIFLLWAFFWGYFYVYFSIFFVLGGLASVLMGKIINIKVIEVAKNYKIFFLNNVKFLT